MKMKWFYSMYIVLIILATCLSGCSSRVEATESPVPGLANPASLYCQGLGYLEETRENELGQFGVCIFPDGSECDTWDFLAGRCGEEFSFCQQQGFVLQSEADQNIGTCVFSDGSSCSELLYFQGECGPKD